MSVRLVTTYGHPLNARLKVEDFPVLIGRSDEADICLPDHWVSRRHCELVLIDGRVLVVDLGSRHGTYVNDHRVDEAWLEPGDELSVGLTTIRFEGSIESPSTGHFELAGVG